MKIEPSDAKIALEQSHKTMTPDEIAAHAVALAGALAAADDNLSKVQELNARLVSLVKTTVGTVERLHSGVKEAAELAKAGRKLEARKAVQFLADLDIPSVDELDLQTPEYPRLAETPGFVHIKGSL